MEDISNHHRAARPAEKLYALYLVVTAGLILISGSLDWGWLQRAGVHLALAAVALFVVPFLGNTGWRSVLRDWLPIACLPPAYIELAVMNDLFTSTFHDTAILAIEAAVFRSQPSVDLRHLIPIRPLSEYLHLAYFSYYFLLPIAGGVLYAARRREAFRYLVATTLVSFLVCYTIFICFPVGGPWNHFPRPLPSEVGTFIPPIVHYVLIKGESVGTAFPSSHVAVAVTVWLTVRTLDERVFLAYFALVPGLVIGTVYCGFHYAIDVVFGVLLAVAVVGLAPRIYTALGGEMSRVLHRRGVGPPLFRL